MSVSEWEVPLWQEEAEEYLESLTPTELEALNALWEREPLPCHIADDELVPDSDDEPLLI